MFARKAFHVAQRFAGRFSLENFKALVASKWEREKGGEKKTCEKKPSKETGYMVGYQWKSASL